MIKALKVGGIYFAAVFALGFCLGVVRTLLLLPRVGETPAVLLELPVILAASWFICARLLRQAPLSAWEAAVMGASAFALLMIAEAVLSVVLANRSLAEHLALYAQSAHLLGLAGQVAFALIPVIQASRSRAPGGG